MSWSQSFILTHQKIDSSAIICHMKAKDITFQNGVVQYLEELFIDQRLVQLHEENYQKRFMERTGESNIYQCSQPLKGIK